MLMTSGVFVRFDQKKKKEYIGQTLFLFFFLLKAIEHFQRKTEKKYETLCYR